MKKQLLLLLAAASFAITACAQDKADEQKIREMIHDLAPDVSVQEIRSTPIPGLFEVVVDNTIMYTNFDGRYLVYGEIIDLASEGYNLTEAARGRVRLDLVHQLNPNTLITYPAKKEKYVIYVFTDIDCPYCKQFHDQMKEINKEGITVKYVAFPRQPEGTSTYDKAVKVWCAKDPFKAMTLAYAGKMNEIEIGTPSSECGIVEEHMKIVRELKLTGTPAVLFPNGSLLPGYVPVELLVEEVRNNAAKP